jgi:integrase/recombinase XerD
MSLGKQAKVLNETQQKVILSHLDVGRHAQRNVVMFLLSCDAALRAKEIAELTWEMLTDAEGNLTDEIRLQDKASKGRSGGLVYQSKRLQIEVRKYAEGKILKGRVITSQRGGGMTAQTVINWFYSLYHELGYEGCSSHSGRRSACSRWYKNIHAHGGTILDVSKMMRHSSVSMTMKYIDVNETACRKVVG